MSRSSEHQRYTYAAPHPEGAADSLAREGDLPVVSSPTSDFEVTDPLTANVAIGSHLAASKAAV